jgi:hypothetical protein
VQRKVASAAYLLPRSLWWINPAAGRWRVAANSKVVLILGKGKGQGSFSEWSSEISLGRPFGRPP